MNKRLIAVIMGIIIVVAGVGLYAVLKKDNTPPSTNTTSTPTETTSSTDPAEYKKCVEGGGVVNTNAGPSRCVLDGKTYHEGNF